MSGDLVRVGLRGLLYTGDVLVEVEGAVLVGSRIRVSDILSAPEKMQTVIDAFVTRHLPGGLQQEVAPEIAVNRDRMLLVTVQDELRAGEPGMRINLDAHDVKLLCPGFEVTGTLHTPLGGSPSNLVTTSGGRFVGLTDARVTTHQGEPMPSFGGVLPFCLVNRAAIQVVIGLGSPRTASPVRGSTLEAPV